MALAEREYGKSNTQILKGALKKEPPSIHIFCGAIQYMAFAVFDGGGHEDSPYRILCMAL